jgi:hypothetical protein
MHIVDLRRTASKNGHIPTVGQNFPPSEAITDNAKSTPFETAEN